MITTENNLFVGLKNHLDRDSGMPLYLQLSQALENLIQRGAVGPEDRLPGNVELGEMIGVNISTVSKAMSRLVDKGLVVRRRRAGTFVSPQATVRHGNVGFYYIKNRESITLTEAEAIQNVLGEHQYDLKLIPIEWDFYKQINIKADIGQRGLDGAVFTALPYDACREVMLELEAAGFPHARIGSRCYEDELHSPLVAGNDGQRMKAVFDRLGQAGHQHIGLLGSCVDSLIANDYQIEMKEHAEAFNRWHLPLNFDNSGPIALDVPIAEIARGYLSKNSDLTAVIVWNAQVADQLIAQAKALGRTVPDDLSVICLSDCSGIDENCSYFKLNRPKMAGFCGHALLKELGKIGAPPAGSSPGSNNTYLPFNYFDCGSVATCPEPVGSSFSCHSGEGPNPAKVSSKQANHPNSPYLTNVSNPTSIATLQEADIT